jgi:hypothetical protein
MPTRAGQIAVATSRSARRLPTQPPAITPPTRPQPAAALYLGRAIRPASYRLRRTLMQPGRRAPGTVPFAAYAWAVPRPGRWTPCPYSADRDWRRHRLLGPPAGTPGRRHLAYDCHRARSQPNAWKHDREWAPVLPMGDGRQAMLDTLKRHGRRALCSAGPRTGGAWLTGHFGRTSGPAAASSTLAEEGGGTARAFFCRLRELAAGARGDAPAMGRHSTGWRSTTTGREQMPDGEPAQAGDLQCSGPSHNRQLACQRGRCCLIHLRTTTAPSHQNALGTLDGDAVVLVALVTRDHGFADAEQSASPRWVSRWRYAMR